MTRRRSVSPRRSLRLLAAAVPAVIAAACGSVALEQAAGEHIAAEFAVERVAAPAAESSVAAEPTVAPGSCADLVYTPPSAVEARVGELCVPLEPTSEVVVLVHGGGGYTGSPDDAAIWRSTHLDLGRTTFTVEYALVDPSRASDETLWPLAEQNIKAAVQFVRMDGSLAAERIVVHGFSAGARLGGIVATTGDHQDFVGDELWPGVSDAVDGAILFYGYYDDFQFHADAYYGADAPVIAVEEIDGADPDILVVHGTDDGLVPVSQSAAFVAAYDTVDASATLVLVEGANHAFDGYGTAELTADGVAMLGEIDSYLFGVGSTSV